jgi:invasion protein IalB
VPDYSSIIGLTPREAEKRMGAPVRVVVANGVPLKFDDQGGVPGRINVAATDGVIVAFLTQEA